MSFLDKLLRRKRQHGSVAALPHRGGVTARLDAPQLALLTGCLQQTPDATLAELQAALVVAGGVKVSRTTLWEGLQRLDSRRKKKDLHASERDTERVLALRRAFIEAIQQEDFTRFKFVDETGTHPSYCRRYGRAPGGQRTGQGVPLNKGTNITVVAALTPNGLEAVMSVPGALTGKGFTAYLDQVLGPTLVPGDVVVLDNLRVHKAPGLAELVEKRGARLLFLPPYSPDFTPVELAFSTLKTFLRTAQARTREALTAAVRAALNWIDKNDAQNWFHHCGYHVH